MNPDVLQKQISQLKSLLSLPNNDFCWSHYSSADEVINELNLLEKRIKSGDCTAINDLIFLLAPTGDLQEISISSGWGDDFNSVADLLEREFDSHAE